MLPCPPDPPQPGEPVQVEASFILFLMPDIQQEKPDHVQRISRSAIPVR